MRVLILLISIFLAGPLTAHARVVSNVQVTPVTTGYEIEIEFLFPILYQSHTPSGAAQELRVQLRPSNFQQLTSGQVEDLRERITLAWDESTGIPLKEITMEGGEPERPQMVFHFTKEVDITEVRNSDNLQSLIVVVGTEVAAPPALPEGVRKRDVWKSHIYGTVSEFFYRDQTTPRGSQAKINRNEFVTNLDFNHRLRNSRFDIRSQLTGGFKNGLFARVDNDYVNNFSTEVRHKESGWFGKIGRQFRASGGTLDLFDGMHLAYDMAPKLTVNTVFGYPVLDTSVKEVDGSRTFQGVSFDFGTFREYLDFSTYFMTQDNRGFVDRRAVGGEMRYYDNNKFINTVLDYDVFFNRVNIFYASGWMSFTPETSMNLSYDYRNSPSLTTGNAVLGQPVGNLSELSGLFSKSQIYQLAEDRTMVSKSLSGSVTHNLKKDVQLTGGLTVYEAEGTVTSGGVFGTDGTGVDLFYFTQLITYNTFKKNDIVITGLNFDDTAFYYGYGLSLSDQFPVTVNVKLVPNFQLNYRDYKDNNNTRLGVRPGLRLDYRIKKWLRFESEVAAEWAYENTDGIRKRSTKLYISVGFTITF